MRINENKWYLVRIISCVVLPVYYSAIVVTFLQVEWNITKSH